MRVAVLGANGDAGSHIVSSWVQRGRQVLTVVRRPESVTPNESVEICKLHDMFLQRHVFSKSFKVPVPSSWPWAMASYRWAYRLVPRRHLMNTYLDMALMDGALERTTDLEWTPVRLPYIGGGPSRPYTVKDRYHGPNVVDELHFGYVGRRHGGQGIGGAQVDTQVCGCWIHSLGGVKERLLHNL